jgi:hypothetical protein
MSVCLHVKYPLFLPDFNGTWIDLTYFEKSSKIKFHVCPSSGVQAVWCKWPDKPDKVESNFSQLCKCAEKQNSTGMNARSYDTMEKEKQQKEDKKEREKD